MIDPDGRAAGVGGTVPNHDWLVFNLYDDLSAKENERAMNEAAKNAKAVEEVPDWIFDEQKDGSWKKREGVKNDGGADVHTYISRNGTILTYNQKTGAYSKHFADPVKQAAENAKNRHKQTVQTAQQIGAFGDAVALTGYLAAPFTSGGSMSISLVGEGISYGATILEHSANFKAKGMTAENNINWLNLTFGVKKQ